MLNRSFIPALCLAILMIFSSVGCKKSCPVCHYYGINPTTGYSDNETCFNNVCLCPNGYEGDSCHTLSALKFTNRTFLASDNCSGTGQYYVTIFGDPYNFSHLTVNNMFGLGQSMEVYIASGPNHTATTLYFATDETFGSNQIVASGSSGLYQLIGGLAKITFNLDYLSGGIERNCSVTLYQQ